MDRLSKLQANSKYKIDITQYADNWDTKALIAQNNGPYKEHLTGEKAVGLDVTVQWQAEGGKWFDGKVERYLVETDEYFVQYFDGDTSEEKFEDLYFCGEHFEKKKDEIVKLLHGPEYTYVSIDTLLQLAEEKRKLDGKGKAPQKRKRNSLK